MNYRQALDYLYNLVDYSKQRVYRYSPETLDLSRVHALLALLGDPHRAYPSLHIAGTKGKGSVAAMSAAVLQAAGLRVGLYTSPHLHDFRERIQVDGRLISEDELAELVAAIRPPVAEVGGLTMFEVTTALAFQYFARQRVDFAVIEVGLGGRLDATNVLTPLVSAITSLSYDHMQLLGNTLAEIAGEKAGIIKAGVPVVSAPQPPEAHVVVERVAAERQAPLILVGRDYHWCSGSVDWRVQPSSSLQGHGYWDRVQPWPAMQSFSLWAGSGPERSYHIPLLGQHQVVNATVAVATLDQLRNRGLAIPESAVERGLAGVWWPGRLEILSASPTVVVDSAHNADSAEKLIAALEELFPNRPRTLIFGAMADKDIRGMLSLLASTFERVILSQAVHPRAADPEELADVVTQLGKKPEVIYPPAQALEEALSQSRPGEVIVATGSLFIVAEVREAWLRRQGQTPAFTSVSENVPGVIR